MPRTINRTPYTVNEPDIDYYFFNHNNWKGQCDDKNFLGVDQESFEDVNNIYIDAEGVLKTRPSVVDKTYSNLTDRKVIEVQSFEDVLVIKNLDSTSNKYYYNFYHNDVYKASGEVTENSKILLFDNKLFIFTGRSDKPYAYYNLKNDTYYDDASSLIYIPNINTYTADGVTENESKNILTNSYKETYLYNSLGVSDNIYGKKVQYKLLDSEITIDDFSENTSKYVFSLKSLSNTYLAYTNGTGDVDTDTDINNIIPLSTVYKSGNVILICKGSNKSVIHANNIIYYYQTTSLLFSIDNGKHYKTINLPDGYCVNAIPALSETADSIFILMRDSETPTTAGKMSLYRMKLTQQITDEYDVSWQLIDDTITQFTFCSISAYNSDNFALSDFLKEYVYADGKRVSVPSHGSVGRKYSKVFAGPNGIFVRIYVVDDDGIYENVFFPSKSSTDKYTVLLSDNITVIPYYYPECISCKITYDPSLEFPYYVASTVPNAYTSTEFTYGAITYYYKDTFGSQGSKLGAPIRFANTLPLKLFQAKFYNDEMFISFPNLQKIRNIVILTPGEAYCSDGSQSPINIFYCEYDGLCGISQIDTGSKNFAPRLISNDLSSSETIPLVYTYEGSTNKVLPSCLSTLNRNVIAIDNVTYVDDARENDTRTEKLLYFPSLLSKRYDYDVNALHPISTSQMGVFFDDSVWIIQASESKLTNTIYTDYLYTKSQVSVGVTKGSDVITSYDGKYVIFATQRGLVTMSYQDFVASTDQSLSYLSDAILVPFVEYCKNNAIKLYMYRYWLICYKQDADTLYVMDMRNNSWWLMTYFEGLMSACTIDYKPLLVSDNSIKVFDKDDVTCKDGNGKLIKWSLTSQKLHFNAPNYYKHVYSLTISAVNNTEKPVSYLVTIVNYRNMVNIDTSDVMEYQVDVVRTYVKRLNYSKVNEFQYILYNSASAPSRLSISNITTKYTITSLAR